VYLFSRFVILLEGTARSGGILRHEQKLLKQCQRAAARVEKAGRNPKEGKHFPLLVGFGAGS
jgi:hypothetical protein